MAERWLCIRMACCTLLVTCMMNIVDQLQLEDASGGRYQMVGDFNVDVPAYNGLFAMLAKQWPQYDDELEISKRHRACGYSKLTEKSKRERRFNMSEYSHSDIQTEECSGFPTTDHSLSWRWTDCWNIGHRRWSLPSSRCEMSCPCDQC